MVSLNWSTIQEAFENTLRSEILAILTHDLTERIFSTKSSLAMFMPLMWGLMDISASEWQVPAKEFWQKSSFAFLLDGVSVWLVFMPMLKEVLILVGKLTRTTPKNQCLEIMKNFLSSCTLVVPCVIVIATYGYLFSFYTLLPVATRWQPFGVWDRMGCETRTYDTHEIFAGTTGFARQSSCQCSPQKIIVGLCWFCFFTQGPQAPKKHWLLNPQTRILKTIENPKVAG